jgi:hypothetical protein
VRSSAWSADTLWTFVRVGGAGLSGFSTACWYRVGDGLLLRASTHVARSEPPVFQPAVLSRICFSRIPACAAEGRGRGGACPRACGAGGPDHALHSLGVLQDVVLRKGRVGKCLAFITSRAGVIPPPSRRRSRHSHPRRGGSGWRNDRPEMTTGWLGFICDAVSRRHARRRSPLPPPRRSLAPPAAAAVDRGGGGRC